MIIKKYRKKPVIIEAYISEEELIIHTLEAVSYTHLTLPTTSRV